MSRLRGLALPACRSRRRPQSPPPAESESETPPARGACTAAAAPDPAASPRDSPCTRRTPPLECLRLHVELAAAFISRARSSRNTGPLTSKTAAKYSGSKSSPQLVDHVHEHIRRRRRHARPRGHRPRPLHRVIRAKNERHRVEQKDCGHVSSPWHTSS